MFSKAVQRAVSRRLLEEGVTPGLSTCFCPSGVTKSGVVCDVCRRVVFVKGEDHNPHCHGCDKKTEDTVPCAGCNYQWCPGCHEEEHECGLYYGIDPLGGVQPFCYECFEEVKVYVTDDQKNSSFVDCDFEPKRRNDKLTGRPPPKKKRKTVEKKRFLKNSKDLMDECPNPKCKMAGCSHASVLDAREKVRKNFEDRRFSSKPWAKATALEYAFQHIGISACCVKDKCGRKSKKNPLMKCSYCKELNPQEWKPQSNHRWSNCGHKAEGKGHRWECTAEYQLPLLTGGSLPVCVDMWKNTFGIGKRTAYKLKKLKLAPLPCSIDFRKEFYGKGRKGTGWAEKILWDFNSTLVYRFSHFNMLSEKWFLQCASSVRQLYFGPCDTNDDGSVQDCFLKFLDKNNGTNHCNYYQKLHKNKRYWVGRRDTRSYPIPPGEHPKPAISIHTFYKFFQTLDIRFKEFKVDMCDTCMKYRHKLKELSGKTSAAAVAERKTILAELKEHQIQAAKAYEDRKKRREATQKAWKDATDIDWEKVPTPQLYKKMRDFIQCDMGGGLRTPFLRCASEYFMMTLNSKVYYVCSAHPENDISSYWWNETVSGMGANDVISVLHKYVTERPTGAGALDIWGDGTFSQLKNEVLWMWLIDVTNPDSPTYVDEAGVALYREANFFNGIKGHTYMLCDACHGIVSRCGCSKDQVATLLDWVEVAKECGFYAHAMTQEEFFDFRIYLRQMYRTSGKKRRTDNDGGKVKLNEYRWANAGYGRRLVDGQEAWVHHPNVIWLRKCNGEVQEEWWRETPVEITITRTMNSDGTHTKNPRKILKWLTDTKQPLTPIDDFVMYTAPLGYKGNASKKARHLHKQAKLLDAAVAFKRTGERVLEVYPKPEDSETEDSGEDIEDDD